MVSPRLEVPRHIPRPSYVGETELPELAQEFQVQNEAGVSGMRAAGRLAALIRDFVGTLVQVRIIHVSQLRWYVINHGLFLYTIERCWQPGVTTDEIDKAAHEAIVDSGAYLSLLG